MAQLGSLIVTGTSRFLNKINGACTDGTSGTTKYMRQDGTWQVPPNDQFTLAVSGTQQIALSKNGTAQNTITVPYATSAGSAAPTSHTHGNIQNGGTLQTTDVAIASGDKLVITDSSDSSKVARSSLAFSAAVSTQSQTTKFLREDGSWAAPSYTTDTNNAVTQTATTTSANYEILFSGTADDTTRTEGARKTSTFTYNPSKMSFLVGTLASGTTLGDNAIVFGTNIQASGIYSYAEGYGHVASGFGSHAEGENNTVGGRCAHVEGSFTTANGWYSHSEGEGTIAKFKSQHVFGDFNIEDPSTTTSSGRGNYVEIVGNGTANNARSNVRTLDWYGNEWIAKSLVVGSLKSGTTIGAYSTAVGYNVTASSNYSLAEGFQTTASGSNSHAEGDNTTASSDASHAEGNNTTASGTNSHTEGLGTTANHKSQHVFGEYNVLDTSTASSVSRGDFVEIVGNGSYTDARSNARTLDWSGNEWLAGNLTLAGASSDVILTGTNNTWDGTNTSLKTAVTALVSANYLKKSGGTMTGNLTLGSSAQNTLPTVGLRVHDVRNVAITPGFIERGVNFFFTNESSSTPYTSSTTWAAILHVKGWKDAYTSWEIAGPAMTGNASNTPLYVRTSNGSSSWGSWRKIYDSGNPPTTSESSIKVKKNISSIPDEEVNSILKLNAVKFDFKSCEENNAVHRGFIAEDVAKILPNLVTDEVVDDDGNLVDPARLNYMEMIPYLVEVCKRQQKEIDELKSLIRK